MFLGPCSFDQKKKINSRRKAFVLESERARRVQEKCCVQKEVALAWPRIGASAAKRSSRFPVDLPLSLRANFCLLYCATHDNNHQLPELRPESKDFTTKSASPSTSLLVNLSHRSSTPLSPRLLAIADGSVTKDCPSFHTAPLEHRKAELLHQLPSTLLLRLKTQT